MPYDEGLAERLRGLLRGRDPVEKKMFGGLTFMVRGHMTVGVMGDALCARVGKEEHADALAQPHARPMTFTGRSLSSMVTVDPEGIERDEDLRVWVDRCLAFNATQPPK